ncbi:MAG: hypothetical protein AB1656_25945 [Candidatus Omnitrophota bacterium]
MSARIVREGITPSLASPSIERTNVVADQLASFYRNQTFALTLDSCAVAAALALIYFIAMKMLSVLLRAAHWPRLFYGLDKLLLGYLLAALASVIFGKDFWTHTKISYIVLLGMGAFLGFFYAVGEAAPGKQAWSYTKDGPPKEWNWIDLSFPIFFIILYFVFFYYPVLVPQKAILDGLHWPAMAKEWLLKKVEKPGEERGPYAVLFVVHLACAAYVLRKIGLGLANAGSYVKGLLEPQEKDSSEEDDRIAE